MGEIVIYGDVVGFVLQFQVMVGVDKVVQCVCGICWQYVDVMCCGNCYQVVMYIMFVDQCLFYFVDFFVVE